jgi:hypothetical protein
VARLTWDTFPKSGSAWLARTLELCYPNHEVEWGGHRSITFIYSPNCITSVRHPRAAVASYACFFLDDNVAGILDWYCRFMERTIKYQHRVYVSQFDNLTVDPMKEMHSYAAMFGLIGPTPVTCEQITDAVRLTHPAHLPSARTDKRNHAEAIVDDCDRLTDAVQLYEALTTD